MSKKIHLKALRLPHWVSTNSLSAVGKQYPNLWYRQLYLQMWMQRSTLVGLQVSRKKAYRKSNSKIKLNWGPTCVKNNFSGISLFSWSHFAQPKYSLNLLHLLAILIIFCRKIIY